MGLQLNAPPASFLAQPGGSGMQEEVPFAQTRTFKIQACGMRFFVRLALNSMAIFCFFSRVQLVERTAT